MLPKGFTTDKTMLTIYMCLEKLNTRPSISSQVFLLDLLTGDNSKDSLSQDPNTPQQRTKRRKDSTMPHNMSITIKLSY